MIDITKVVEAFIALMVAIVTYVLIPYIRSKTKVNDQQSTIISQENADYWIKVAVAAIEQIAVTGNQKGKEKKQYVIDWLNEHNIEIDEEKIDAQIEAAVYQLKNGIIVNNTATTQPEK